MTDVGIERFAAEVNYRWVTLANSVRRRPCRLIPDLLSQNPGLEVALVLSDFVRDMVDDQIDLAIRALALVRLRSDCGVSKNRTIVDQWK
jgi:DNA-binding transcriptional LysR family regulator